MPTQIDPSSGHASPLRATTTPKSRSSPAHGPVSPRHDGPRHGGGERAPDDAAPRRHRLPRRAYATSRAVQPSPRRYGEGISQRPLGTAARPSAFDKRLHNAVDFPICICHHLPARFRHASRAAFAPDGARLTPSGWMRLQQDLARARPRCSRAMPSRDAERSANRRRDTRVLFIYLFIYYS